MADRKLSELIRFLDPSGNMTDADIAEVSRKLKFTDVLDLVAAVGKADESAGRDILSKYDSRFTVAKEYSTMPTQAPGAGPKKIPQQGTVGQLPTTGGQPQAAAQPKVAGQPTQQVPGQPAQTNEPVDMDQLLNDPQKKNSPEVKQIQSLLQRLQQR